MRSLKTLSLALLAMLTLASCGSSSDDSEQMTNYVTVAVSGESTINEDDTTGVVVNVSLAYSLDKPATVTLSMTGDDLGVARLSESTVTFPAGQKTASVKVYSKNAGLLTTPDAQAVITIAPTSFSETNMAPFAGSNATVTIKPAAAVPTLTAAQLALIEGYKTNLGIDLMKVLGIVDVSTTVTYGNDDKDGENGGNDTRTLTGKSIITLSDKATADTPVLKMVSNPMGMTSFMYEKLLRCTAEDEEYFLQDPVSSALFKAVGYDKSKESFSATLDGIKVNADGTLDFTEATTDFNDETITLVNFKYTFSVWDHLSQMAAEGKTVNVNEGDTDVEYAIKDLLDQYHTFNPAYYLGNSDVSADVYGADPSNYVTPAGKADFSGGKMTFTFPWDYGAGSILYDYLRVNVTYTMHK